MACKLLAPCPEQEERQPPAHALHQFRGGHHADPVVLLAFGAFLVEEIRAEINLHGLAGERHGQPEHGNKGRNPHQAGEGQHEGKQRHGRRDAQLVAQENGQQFKLPRRFGGALPKGVVLEGGALFWRGWNWLVAVKITAAGKSFRIVFNAHGQA